MGREMIARSLGTSPGEDMGIPGEESSLPCGGEKESWRLGSELLLSHFILFIWQGRGSELLNQEFEIGSIRSKGTTIVS